MLRLPRPAYWGPPGKYLTQVLIRIPLIQGEQKDTYKL